VKITEKKKSWTPKTLFLSHFIFSDLFAFVVSRNWHWSTFSGEKNISVATYIGE